MNVPKINVLPLEISKKDSISFPQRRARDRVSSFRVLFELFVATFTGGQRIYANYVYGSAKIFQCAGILLCLVLVLAFLVKVVRRYRQQLAVARKQAMIAQEEQLARVELENRLHAAIFVQSLLRKRAAEKTVDRKKLFDLSATQRVIARKVGNLEAQQGIALREIEVPDDANCLFSALSFALFGTIRNHKEIRKEIANWLFASGHFEMVEGLPLMLTEEDVDWKFFCERMKKEEERGTTSCLVAAAEIFQVKIHTISSSSEKNEITPKFCEARKDIFLVLVDEHYNPLVPDPTKRTFEVPATLPVGTWACSVCTRWNETKDEICHKCGKDKNELQKRRNEQSLMERMKSERVKKIEKEIKIAREVRQQNSKKIQAVKKIQSFWRKKQEEKEERNKKKEEKEERKKLLNMTASQRTLARKIAAVEKQNNISLREVQVSDDGNCLFYALSLGIFGSTDHHKAVRYEIAQWLANNQTYEMAEGLPITYTEVIEWIDFCADLLKNKCFGNVACLYAAAEHYKVNIHVISAISDYTKIVPKYNKAVKTVWLVFADNHYNLLVPDSSKKSFFVPEVLPNSWTCSVCSRWNEESDQTCHRCAIAKNAANAANAGIAAQ